MNDVKTKRSNEKLLDVDGGIIVYDNDTGKYWVFHDRADLYSFNYSYDQQSAIDRAMMLGLSTRLYSKETFRAEFGDAACFYGYDDDMFDFDRETH